MTTPLHIEVKQLRSRLADLEAALRQVPTIIRNTPHSCQTKGHCKALHAAHNAAAEEVEKLIDALDPTAATPTIGKPGSAGSGSVRLEDRTPEVQGVETPGAGNAGSNPAQTPTTATPTDESEPEE